MAKRWLKRTIAALGVVFGFGVIYCALFLSFANVPTGAMKNTILVGDHIVSNVLMGKVKRGDVVLFKYPANPSVIYVKRVIGLPGERIQIVKDKVLINGEELPERRARVSSEPRDDPGELRVESTDGSGPYTVYYQASPGSAQQGIDASIIFADNEAYTIPQGEYFVLGDNRDNSEDSRYYGTIPARMIVGKSFLIYWSSDKGSVRWSRIFSRIR